MFNSTILDVAVGVIFTFLGISLITSAITEAIASGLKVRHDTLLQGVKALLNYDAGEQNQYIVQLLYNHGLIAALAPGNAAELADFANRPAYIRSRDFGTALIDVLQRLPEAEDDLGRTLTKIDNPPLRQVLQTLYARARGDVAAFETELAGWFDSAMDRVSGWFKRWTQAVGFTIALGAAILVNADAVHVMRTLWDRPILAQQLARDIEAHAGTAADPAASAAAVTSVLGRADFPIGWNPAALDAMRRPTGILLALVGWLLTAVSTLFGASFWFDALQRITQLRGTGKAFDPLAASPGGVRDAAG